jgi:hypothetical protein
MKQPGIVKEDSDISVAVCYPGGRIDRLTKPLNATDMQVEVSPTDPYSFDIVMLDNADKSMPVVLTKAKLRNTPVIYRIRGDMLRAYMEMNRFPIKYKTAKYLISKVDGAISLEKRLAKRFEAVTGVSPIGYAGLVKEWDEWPTVEHRIEDIYAITLTNCNYWGKIQPLIDYAPAIDEFLIENGGSWRIFGRGRYTTYLQDHLAHYETISFDGYTENPKEELEVSNLMLHFSNFDSLPNAVLEGMASNLPVVANPYTVFERHKWPINIVNESNIKYVLDRFSDPEMRKLNANVQKEYIQDYHNAEYVGNQFVEYYKRILE